MADNLIIEIILKYARQEKLDTDEYALLEKWQARWGQGHLLKDLIHDPEWLRICLYRQHGLPDRRDWRELRRLIAATGDPLPALRIDPRWVGGVISAAAIILITITAHFVRISRRNTPETHSDGIAHTVVTTLPLVSDGRAELTCQNGRKIQIDSVADDGIIAEEGNVIIRRLNRHTLQYEVQPDKPLIPMNHFFYAGMTDSYKLLFPDGSWVQLKNGASLRYSPNLRGTGRPVALNGKAWFSVAKNNAAPLSILANGTTVDVLGTEFLISSATTATKVCVYRGAVRVQQGPKSITLRDSDEVVVQQQVLQPKKKVSDFDALLAGTDIDQRFHFDNCSLAEAVQQIADYYHADVSNLTHIRGIPVKGDPQQSLPLRSLLKDIELIENGNAWLGLSNKTILISGTPIR